MAAQNTSNPESVQVPPLRTNLNDPQATDQTAKEWYLFWQKSGSRINTLNQMIAYGLPGARPLPKNVPDGALYVESNDGEILYQKQADGAWHYVAGTEWNTLNPDHRPTGLGADDAGYTYRTTDAASAYSARTFVWSGSLWIETTASHYDTHAARLAVNISSLENGFLWVETDRSEVLYQLQGTAWHYLAGTMWGTITPDQRPTDLGANDAGFQYRGTDVQRYFIWSGSVWIEVTSSNYSVNGTLVATRPGLNLINGSNVTISGLDNPGSNRVDVTISSSAGSGGGAVTSVFTRTGAVVAVSSDYAAFYPLLTGAYADPGWITALSWGKITGAPAIFTDPTTTKGDLIAHGTTTTRLAVGANNQMVMADSTQTLGVKWGTPTAAMVTNAVDQTGAYTNPAWITSLPWSKITGAPTVPQAGDVQIAKSSGNLTLTTSYVAVPGATITLNRAGRYLIIGNYTFDMVNDAGQGLRGDLVAGGTQQGGGVLVTSWNNNDFVSGSQQWIYTAASSGVVVYLVATKDGGTGTSAAWAPFTSITAIWIST